ncbi:hypothetical protein ACTJJ0_28685 [Chitinophaga sp. 22321]|uniref:Uncharacterized protein n=1 Tax=Chitinophaga hostae TaxID=2831022 RepID=A0ABS5J901_9BACT|nr:hypothetical protein [Chitinophaga hostae]MBS0031703.1 hypothetical protein [Chitinophaga hostae]
MEKINALIEKLQELKNSGADLSAISYYAQLLQAEVLHARNKLHQQQVQSSQSNIAVIMPAQSPVTVSMPASTAAQTTTLPSNKPPAPPATVEVKPENKPVEATVAPTVQQHSQPAGMDPRETQEDINTRAARFNGNTTNNNFTPSEDINTRAAKAAEHTAPLPANQVLPPTATPAANNPPAVAYEPAPVTPQETIPFIAAETPPAADLVPPKPEPVVTAQPIPTLAANQPSAEKHRPATLFDDIPAYNNGHANGNTGELRKDLNDLVGNNNNATSLNDRLRQQQVEVAQKLGDMPIKDLRSAIGINDKYQFIQELFRGDRDLYERSIKTINECGNLQEADYWIQREIKIIQGWQDDHHLVQHFYALLKKRFS